MEIYYTYTCRYIAKFEMNSSSCGLAAKTPESPSLFISAAGKPPICAQEERVQYVSILKLRNKIYV